MILILSSSLSSDSNSRILARAAQRVLEQDGETVSWVDLRDFPLPLCDGEASDRHSNVVRLDEAIQQASAILVAVPVYNYYGSAALKNVIELTGNSWEGKTVGFLCAAGGMNSYMSILSFANSLMLDFRCWIIPRYVYATGSAFSGGQLKDPEIARRVAELAHTAVRAGQKLSEAPATA